MVLRAAKQIFWLLQLVVNLCVLSYVLVVKMKLESINDFLCSSLWGNQNYGFSYRPSVGASGGILTIWDSTEVDVIITRSLAHVVIIQGKMVKNGADFSLANVYAPCDSLRRQVVWTHLGTIIGNFRDMLVCLW